MILEEETYKKWGYYPRDLKPQSGKKTLAACDDCGKVRVTSKNHYYALCRSCAQKKRKGEKSARWKGGKIKRICELCGKEFYVKPSEIKKGGGGFCSLSCARKGEKNPNWKGGKITRICETCGKEFEVIPCEIKNGFGKFCSHKCHGKWLSKHKIGENNSAWKGGISFEPYCPKFNFAFKEYIRNKFGRIYFLCRKTETENGRRLSVHHVNYNKDCGCGDDDTTCQFVPLCISCNSKVNGNRNEWEKKIKTKMRNTLNGWYI